MSPDPKVSDPKLPSAAGRGSNQKREVMSKEPTGRISGQVKFAEPTPRGLACKFCGYNNAVPPSVTFNCVKCGKRNKPPESTL